MSKFNARPIKPLGFSQTVRKILKHKFGIHILLQVFKMYEEKPEEPEMELPEELGDIPDEQLALCQSLFDECEERRARVEKKALWTFAAIAFLTPRCFTVRFRIRNSTKITARTRSVGKPWDERGMAVC